MIKYLLAIQILFASSVICGELRFGPRLGMLMPGQINGVPTRPGNGFYWGAAAEFPISSLFTVEFAAGAAFGMGEPYTPQLPGFPAYGSHDADFFAADLALSVNPLFFNFAAGPGYYCIRMDWLQNLTGSSREWKTVELNSLGYHFSIGVHPFRNVDFRLAFHFPENAWGVLSLTWQPFKV